MQEKKVAIIGAGVSGLSAAVALAERGVRNVTVFEARKEAGGRTRSYLDPETGDVLDNGQHLLMGCYRETLRYLNTIGSSQLYHREPMRIFFHRPATAPVMIDMPERSKPPANLLAALRSSKLLTAREKLSAVWLGLGIYSSWSMKRWEGRTCAELFEMFHQPDELVRKLWGPIVVAVINAPVERASAAVFVSFFKEAFLAGRSASDFLIPTVGLSELLIDPAIAYLEKNGGRMVRSTPIRSIGRKDGGFRLLHDRGEEAFDALIYTSQTTEALPAELTEFLPIVEFSPIVNAYFWLDQAIFTAPIHAYLGTTLQWSFTRPSQFAAQRLALTVSAAAELAAKPNEEIKEILWNDLCSAVPEMGAVTLVHYQIIKEKRATPLLTPEVQQARPAVSTNVPGLFFGGDIVQNRLPGTIEGAIRNGYAAAEKVRPFLS